MGAQVLKRKREQSPKESKRQKKAPITIENANEIADLMAKQLQVSRIVTEEQLRRRVTC